MHPNKENIDPRDAKHSYTSLIAPTVLQEMLGTLKFKKVKQKVIKDFKMTPRLTTWMSRW